ncbi:hypothetical protein [Albimonas pacifica]|uniref:Uncharacterized protein n=1 Tax=Albimonas pacifica TaxID=1114924 RepID=A0A1I3MHT9_9RHOB|nr:hypothetical protein [Albimonas pacifica]SFI96492.1 hypothetical protein SAMN05216258_111111 [Albimonas pacifica]
MRVLSSVASLARSRRPERTRGPAAGHALAAVPAAGAGASHAAGRSPPGPEDETRRDARLDALLERARARMARTMAEGGEARAAAASHEGPEGAGRDAPDAALRPSGLGWTYAAASSDGIRASAWSDRLARARLRAGGGGAGLPGSTPVSGVHAAGTGPFRLSAREAAVVIGPDFGEDVFDVAPGQCLVFAFSAPPPTGLAGVEIAAEKDAMRLALVEGPVVRLRGLDASGRVTLSMNDEEIELSPGAPAAAVDARI